MKRLITLAALLAALVMAGPVSAQNLVEWPGNMIFRPVDPDIRFYGTLTFKTAAGNSMGVTIGCGTASNWSGTSYQGLTSCQPLSVDLTLAAGAGSSTAASPSYLAPIMGNATIAAVNLTATQSIVAGGIFKIDHTGTNASNYPSAALIAEVGDKANNVDGAVIAAFGGDSGTASVTGALFGVSWWNSTLASAIDYGLDLEGKPVAGNNYVATPRYAKAFARYGGRYSNAGTVETVNDICELFGTAAPTDGVTGTGAGDCASGSRYTRQSGATSKLYINTNTKASPTWTIVGTQS